VRRGKGILLGDYIIKFHAPEILARKQLDNEELPYTWTDPDGNERASDDGGRLPPKGWWPRPEFTWIDCERSSVRGNAQIPPFFPPMYGVRVYPAVSPAAKAKGRPSPKSDLVWDILTEIDQSDEGLPADLLPAVIDRKVLALFRPRWAKLRPDDKTDPPVSRRRIYEVYQEYLKTRSSK
jgi:hypothetical protein